MLVLVDGMTNDMFEFEFGDWKSCWLLLESCFREEGVEGIYTH